MEKKPNIIIFNPDQWRADVMGHLGNSGAVTPFIDRFVKDEAISFRNCFSQSTVCTPSRCSFLTGLYPHIRGHRTMHHMLHHEFGETNVLTELKNSGYNVLWVGKNDLVPGDSDISLVANEKFVITKEFLEKHNLTFKNNSHINSLEWQGDKNTDSFYSFYRGKLEKTGEVYADPDWCNVIAAIDFIKTYESENPFCILFALSYPHPPYGVEEPFYSMIDRAKLPPRVTTFAEDEPIILSGIRENQKLQNWSEERWTELRATYYGMCARVDRQFELVVESLKSKDLYDDSAVFLISDHGDFTGDYGLVEKAQNTFPDCLTHVPLIFKAPKNYQVTPGVRDGLIELLDLSETIYELAELDPPYRRFGKSLIPYLDNLDYSYRETVFCEGGRLIGEIAAMERESGCADNSDELYYPRISLQSRDDKPFHGKAVMCRTDKYKYIFRLYEKDQFYDLTSDPSELNNLIDNIDYAELVNQFRERTLRHMVETADIVPYKTDVR